MRKTFLSTRVLRAVVLAVGGAIAFVGSALPAEAQLSSGQSFTLGGSSPKQRAFDVTSGFGPWRFDVTVTGTVSTLVLSIRDSSPGDFCWFLSIKQPQPSFTVDSTAIPAAGLEACGTEYLDVNGVPLVFFAGFQGGKSGRVTTTVTYPAP